MHVQQRTISILATAAALIGVTVGPNEAAAATTYVAIDMFPTSVELQSAHRGAARRPAANSALILTVEGPGQWWVRAMTVEAGSGARLGDVVDVAAPPNPCLPPNPCDILYSQHFAPGAVMVLGDDMAVADFAISILPDGTPAPGPFDCYPPDPIAPDLGPACAMTEMPGAYFSDDSPRLFIGTESGMIAMFLHGNGELILDGVIDVLAGQPIGALGPIPQEWGVALGAAVGPELFGITDLETLPAVQFAVVHPEAHPVRDFAAARPGEASDPTFVAICDGVNIRVPRAMLSANAAGFAPMDFYPPDPIIPVLTSPPVRLALGSLLMLTDDGQGAYYDPDFDVMTGPSGCIGDVDDPDAAVCVACGVAVTGDVNTTGNLTSADIISLVGFIFKSGPPPQPCEAAGDVNCTGTVNSADVIHLVNHLFKGGAAPCDVCTLIPGIWSCP